MFASDLQGDIENDSTEKTTTALVYSNGNLFHNETLSELTEPNFQQTDQNYSAVINNMNEEDETLIKTYVKLEMKPCGKLQLRKGREIMARCTETRLEQP